MVRGDMVRSLYVYAFICTDTNTCIYLHIYIYRYRYEAMVVANILCHGPYLMSCAAHIIFRNGVDNCEQDLPLTLSLHVPK